MDNLGYCELLKRAIFWLINTVNIVFLMVSTRNVLVKPLCDHQSDNTTSLQRQENSHELKPRRVEHSAPNLRAKRLFPHFLLNSLFQWFWWSVRVLRLNGFHFLVLDFWWRFSTCSIENIILKELLLLFRQSDGWDPCEQIHGKLHPQQYIENQIHSCLRVQRSILDVVKQVHRD